MMKRIIFYIGSFFSLFITSFQTYYNYVRLLLWSGAIARKISVSEINSFTAEYPTYFVGGSSIHIKSGHIRRHTRISAIKKYNESTYKPIIEIGHNANFGINNHIGCINRIVIGDNFLSGANCLITDHSHGGGKDSSAMLSMPPNDRPLICKGEITIGNNVHIGENVIILPGVSIGDGVIIGAGSVVTKNIPSNCVACGNPAIVKKIIQ